MSEHRQRDPKGGEWAWGVIPEVHCCTCNFFFQGRVLGVMISGETEDDAQRLKEIAQATMTGLVLDFGIKIPGFTPQKRG